MAGKPDPVLQAVQLPAMAGYPIPIYRQPLFVNCAVGPYVGSQPARSGADHDLPKCPCCEILSTDESVWLPHRLLLGTRQDMDDVATAIRKVVDHRAELASAR